MRFASPIFVGLCLIAVSTAQAQTLSLGSSQDATIADAAQANLILACLTNCSSTGPTF